MQQVGTVAQRVPAVGGLGREGFGLDGLKPLDFQEFRHPIDPTGLARDLHLDGDSPRAIASAVPPEDVADEGHQFTILLLSSRLDQGLPGVIACAADLEGIAHGGHSEDSLEGELFDQGVGVGYALRLKMANAFFKMSRSRSTRRSSSSSWATRSPRVRAAGPARCTASRFQR